MTTWQERNANNSSQGFRRAANLSDELVSNAPMDRGWSTWLLVRDSDPVSALAITQDLLMCYIL